MGAAWPYEVNCSEHRKVCEESMSSQLPPGVAGCSGGSSKVPIIAELVCCDLAGVIMSDPVMTFPNMETQHTYTLHITRQTSHITPVCAQQDQ